MDYILNTLSFKQINSWKELDGKVVAVVHLEQKGKEDPKDQLDLMEQRVNMEKKDNQEILDGKVNQDRKETQECQDVMEQMVKMEIQDQKET